MEHRCGQSGPKLASDDECGELSSAFGNGIISYLLDGDLTFLWANDRFFSSTDYSPGEYQTCFHNLRQYYADYPEDFEHLKKSLAGALTKGDACAELALRVPAKGGFFSARVTVIIAHADSAADCHPVCYAVLNDIGKMAQSNDIMRLYEEKSRNFEWMLDEYVGNIYVSDMETYELLYLNKTACDVLFETLHIGLNDALGKKCYEIIQERTSPCPFCTNDRLREDECYEWEFYNPILERTFIIKNRIVNWKGRRARIELSHDNYSVEYKLAKKDREREAIMRTIPGGFSRLDARDMSTVLWYGADFLEMIGYTKEQFENELHFQCTYMHPDDFERQLSIMNKLQKNGQSEVFECRVITHNKEVKFLTMTLCYVSGEDSWDGIPSFYSVGIDITKARQEQARQRKALEEAYQAARVANMAKTTFLSSMSHDIRTPMNAIIGMTSIAQSNLESPDKVSDCLKKINTSSMHLLNLINEVLDMSKIESGKIDLEPENVNLSDLIQNVADMCRPLITEKQHEFHINIGQIQHEKIIADGDRLQQVFMNLLSNAIKYTPAGGTIDLKINELHSAFPNIGQYEFVFTDNGIGMPGEYITHIFEPFSRAEDSRISKIQGTGLGMAITENIVRMMNGTINVKSELGSGSCFTVSIPLEVCMEEEACVNELEGLSVLVVDDDQVVCESATALLNEMGIRGHWVLSGAQAVQSVAAAHDSADDFFAVILDWKMPETDGLETLKIIRRNLGSNVPIIIISAYDFSDIEEEFVNAGADAFITKPLFKSKMLHVLRLFCSDNNEDSASSLMKGKLHALAGKRILLAEDNGLNREIASELLQMQGILVDAVENGQLAVDAYLASPHKYYDAILMDIQMPVMDGYAATTEIRSMNRDDARSIPILALTANAFATDVAKAHNVGMDAHIAKPIDLKCLMETLHRLIK